MALKHNKTMNKQDEEKAREIANQSPIYFMHIYNGCLEMAAWKEQQMIQWLDENASSYVSIYWETGGYATPEYDTEKMIKDFKKAIEGE